MANYYGAPFIQSFSNTVLATAITAAQTFINSQAKQQSFQYLNVQVIWDSTNWNVIVVYAEYVAIP